MTLALALLPSQFVPPTLRRRDPVWFESPQSETKSATKQNKESIRGNIRIKHVRDVRHRRI